MADDLKLIIEGESSSAVDAAREVKAAEDELIQATEKTGFSFTELNQALEVATKVFDTLVAAAKLAYEAIDQGSIINDVSESFARMTARAGELSNVFLDDLKTATAGTIAEFDLMKSSIEAMRTGAKPDEFVKLAEAARVLAEETGGNLKEELDQLSQAFETGQTRMLKNKLGIIDLEEAEHALASQLGVTREELSKEGQVMAARQAILTAAAAKTKEFGQVSVDAGDSLARMGAAIENVIDDFQAAFASNVHLNKALADLAKVLDLNGPKMEGIATVLAEATALFVRLTSVIADGAIQAWNWLNTQQENFLRGYSVLLQLMEQSANGEWPSLSKAVDDAATAMAKLNVVGKDFSGPTLLHITSGSDEAARAISSISKEAVKATESLDALFRINQGRNFDRGDEKEPGFAEGFMGAFKIPSMEEFGANLNNALQNTLVTALSGGNKKDIFGGLGRELGGQFGPLGEYLGGELGEGIADGLDHAFGGNRDAAHRARNTGNKFLHDMFEETTINIDTDGILQKLEAINFDESAIKAGGWAEALNAASTQVQEGFGGAGLALQELLGLSEEISGQIGFALFDNVGGSLNDLQLILQETGFSLEDMKGSIVDAFESGKVTALDALTALRGVEEVMAAGIPGAVGATGEAFENIKKGGLNSFDALRDLAIEMQEKAVPGVTLSLEDLRAELIAQGKPLEEVDALMTAFAENGVDSLNELAEIGDELALGVLANLQQSTTEFGEALSKTAEDIKSISDELGKLDGRTVDVKVNYHVTTSGDSVPSGAGDLGNPDGT